METESRNAEDNRTMAVAPAKPIEPEVVGPSARTVAIKSIVFPAGVETLGEKANFLHTYSIEAGKSSTAAAILAGWCLSVARESCAHGMWFAWLANNVSFSRSTADNYMKIFEKTIGKARAALRRPIPLSEPPTMAELDVAAHDLDGKCLSALYKSTRLMAKSDWGGSRVEKAAENGHRVGRKPKDVAAELKAVAEHEAVLWASARGALDTLVQLDGRDFLHRLSDEHLAQVATNLDKLAQKAAKMLLERVG